MIAASGIYKITNKIDDKVYIGKTKNFKKRWQQYHYDYTNRRSRSLNSYIMNAMLKYGLESFEFSIVELCAIGECSKRELYWMDFYDSCNLNKGYNLRRDSSSGMITHPSTSIKISLRLKSEWDCGVRSGHSEKMIKSWSQRDKMCQSELMTNLLTKYSYKVTDCEGCISVVVYRQLRELNLHGALLKMNKKGVDVVSFKGYIIERIHVNESKA
jgi:group I intron endonuclease